MIQQEVAQYGLREVAQYTQQSGLQQSGLGRDIDANKGGGRSWVAGSGGGGGDQPTAKVVAPTALPNAAPVVAQAPVVVAPAAAPVVLAPAAAPVVLTPVAAGLAANSSTGSGLEGNPMNRSITSIPEEEASNEKRPVKIPDPNHHPDHHPLLHCNPNRGVRRMTTRRTMRHGC